MTPAGRLLLWRAGIAPHPVREALGTLIVTEAGVIGIATGEGLLVPREVQSESRKAMSWEEFLRGARLGAGARLTEVGA